MEIGEQRIHHRKRAAWVQEDVRLSSVRLQPRCAPKARGTFQRAHGRRAHCNHPPAPCLAGADLVTGGGIDLDALVMHAVLQDILDAHRLERARADMQSHER